MRKSKKKDKRPLKLNKEKLKVMGSGLENMTYKDMKRRAVALGMPFPDACSADYNGLASWIHHWIISRIMPSSMNTISGWTSN